MTTPRSVLSLCLGLLLLCGISVHAAEEQGFVIGEIRIEGLRRISEGTLLNYLPLAVGDRADAERLRAALRALYRSGFFQDIEFRRDGAALIVRVRERPSIASFSFDGNRDIETEELERSLTRAGLAEGRIFDRSILDALKQELTQQYYSRGKYSVRIDTEVVDLGNDQVSVAIHIKEGERAVIRQINIVGNQDFADERLLEEFELSTPHFWSWLTQDDRYARETLSGDLEKLRSFYMDRGYADFRVESVQIAISPDRRSIFATINLHEGEVYTIKETKLTGNLVVPEDDLRRLIALAPGQTFSMAAVTLTSDLIGQRLGNDGYAFAEVTPLPELDEENKQISITFFIDPGERVYVNRVNFTGTGITQDEVYRRELRQLEGSWLSNVALDRSRLRISRLPFVEDVEVETVRVPGTEDRVDLEFRVRERSAGNFQLAVGYGGVSQGLFVNGSLTHANFLGTGERVSVELNSLAFGKTLNFSFTDPYFTIDGVSRTLSGYYSSSERLGRELERFDISSLGLLTSFRWPISEFDALGFSVNLQHNELAALAGGGQTLSDQLFLFLTNPAHGNTEQIELLNGITNYLLTYEVLELETSLIHDTRNRAIFADRGVLRTLALTASVPPGDVTYAALRLGQLTYLPLGAGFTFSINGELSATTPWDDDSDVPPRRKLFGGGSDSVRGFREDTLGPFDERTGVPLGGNMRLFVQNDLVLPNLFADEPGQSSSTARFSLFYDIGNVFSEPAEFEFGELRASAGLSATFLTPIGAMRFSYAYPVREKPGDLFKRFQFTIGTVF